MPTIQTKCFGKMAYAETAAFDFPSGLPGFEQERSFVFLDQPGTEPLMFMQSVATPDLCFILFPIFCVDPAYRLSLEDEDLSALRLPPLARPEIGRDILCAAIVCAGGSDAKGPTANLLAPVVVNLKDRIGIQAIQPQSGYSHQHPLTAPKVSSSC